MSDYLEGILGGVGGFLATGSPLGIAAGALSGIFGGDDQNVTTNTYTNLSREQQNMTSLGNEQMAGLMAQLGPDAQSALIAQLQQQFSGVLKQQAGDAFNLQSGRARANMGRTGGGPSSVMNSQLAQLGTERTKAMNQAQMQGDLMGEQVGAGRFQQSLSAAMGIGGLINSAQSTRRLATSTGSAPGSNIGSLMGGIGAGLTNPNSWMSQNQGALGAFGAPIFGSPAKATDTGGRLQGNDGYNVT